jgi:iron complex outermembrane receptor protein
MTRLAGRVHLALWSGIGLVAVGTPPWSASAQSAVNLGTVQANGEAGTGGNGGAAEVESAPYQAPTKAPLNARQPTSVISQQYIKNNVPLSGNYETVINVAPSVSTISPNGPGLMESPVVAIRGFQDGQYNVTFDGIPWSDSNDFTHHTTSYFMAHDLGEASVDRGPGTASTIGNATFGGTVSLQSKDPSPSFQVTPYTSQGSYNTQLYGVQIDTGAIAAANGATGFIDGEGLSSDGYLTNAAQRRKNVFAKFVVPLNANNVLTFVSMYNTIHQNVSFGATRQQIQQFGPNYGDAADPNSQSYYGYNYDNIHTDFSYIGLNSNLGDGLTLDNKLYTYGYYHHGYNGEDPNGDTPNGTVFSPTDVPGQTMHNNYRSFGDVLRLTKTVGFGDIQAGIWVDHQANDRQQLEVDASLHDAPNPPGANIDWNMNNTLDTIQPYVQVNWKPLPGLTISPGVKFDYFLRDLNASTNEHTGAALDHSQSYSKALPSIAVNYRITPQLSAYAQVAEGFLAPNLNTYYTADPTQSSVSPETSWNYQVGGVYRSHDLTLSADLYYIDFGNLIGSRTVDTVTQFFNQGGVVYKGVEAEATYYAGHGVSVFANGSLNSAKDKQTGQWIANAPSATAATGVIYNRNGVYSSLIEKWVGSRYGDTAQTQGLQPYGVLDFSIGYTRSKDDGPSLIPPGGSIRLEADNLTNNQVIDGLAGYTADNTPLWWTVPGRSIFVTASLTF